MSGRQWKPGDVGSHPKYGRCIVQRAATGLWIEPEDNKHDRHVISDVASDLRPLVVIDPEDREQVERLTKTLANSGAFTGFVKGNADLLHAALRSLIEPPRPEEPAGLGAVIEATCGCNREPQRFVRDPAARDFNLSPLAVDVARGDEVPWVARCGHHGYDGLNVVKVLSEGVQP